MFRKGKETSGGSIGDHRDLGMRGGSSIPLTDKHELQIPSGREFVAIFRGDAGAETALTYGTSCIASASFLPLAGESVGLVGVTGNLTVFAAPAF